MWAARIREVSRRREDLSLSNPTLHIPSEDLQHAWHCALDTLRSVTSFPERHLSALGPGTVPGKTLGWPLMRR